MKRALSGKAMALAGAACASVGVSVAGAGEILTYAGAGFTVFREPFAASDRVTATIDLANALVSILPAEATPTAFEVGDGVETIASRDDYRPDAHFRFHADPSGAIVDWDVEVAHSRNRLDSADAIRTGGFAGTFEDRGTLGGYAYGVGYGYVLDAPGNWTRSATFGVPESPTLAFGLAATASLGLLAAGRRRPAQI